MTIHFFGKSRRGLATSGGWVVPRELLTREAPSPGIAGKPLRIVVQWLAKRCFRATFPTEFNERWRKGHKDWEVLLKRNSEWIQGIYLRLDTSEELVLDRPYRCHAIAAVPAGRRRGGRWAAEKSRLADEIEGFWQQFAPGIICDGVDVLGTDEGASTRRRLAGSWKGDPGMRWRFLPRSLLVGP